jgi:hypothetical protein
VLAETCRLGRATEEVLRPSWFVVPVRGIKDSVNEGGSHSCLPWFRGALSLALIA